MNYQPPLGNSAIVLRLSNPAAQSVLRAYTHIEKRLFYEEARPIIARNPVLLPSIEKSLAQTDPIAAELDSLRDISRLEAMATVVVSRSDAPSSFRQASQNLLEAIGYRRALSDQNLQFYSQLVTCANQVASEIGIRPVEAVRQEASRASVLRRIFPTREDAETLLLAAPRITFNTYEATIKFFDELEAFDGPMPAEIRAALPSLDVAAEIRDASLRNETRQIDQIYGPKR